MFKRVLTITIEWFLPWILGVILIWFVTMPAQSAESVDTAGGSSAPQSLYDATNLPRKIRKIAIRAAAYSKRAEYRKAVDLLTKHQREHPDQDHYLLRLYLAQNLADLDETALAKEQYHQAVSLEPDLDRGWFGLADAAYELEDYETAAAAFANGYRTSPEKPVAVLYYAGAAYLRAENPDMAFAHFSDLVSGRIGSPQLKWYQGLIVAAARMQEPEKADPAVAQMVANFADDPEAWYLKYQHEAGKREFREAAAALRLVGYLRPLSDTENKQLGDLYIMLGVPYLASQQYAVALSDTFAATDFERLGSALVAAHETEKALAVLKEALTEAESPRLWSLLGDIHYLRQEYGPAREAFGRIAAADETGRAWLMQGYCALELGEKEAALDLLGRATSFPEQAEMAQILLQRAMRM